jgi:hypothetical protein
MSVERKIFELSSSSTMGYPDPWDPAYDDAYCVADILPDSCFRLPAKLDGRLLDKQELAVLFRCRDGFGLTADFGDSLNQLILSQEQAKRLLVERGGDPDRLARRHAQRRQAVGLDHSPPVLNDPLLPRVLLRGRGVQMNRRGVAMIGDAHRTREAAAGAERLFSGMDWNPDRVLIHILNIFGRDVLGINPSRQCGILYMIPTDGRQDDNSAFRTLNLSNRFSAVQVTQFSEEKWKWYFEHFYFPSDEAQYTTGFEVTKYGHFVDCQYWRLWISLWQ